MTHQLLQHVLENNCTDPDCEVHNPEVGFAEEVVTEADIAFFYAGAMWMWRNYNTISTQAPIDHLKLKLRL